MRLAALALVAGLAACNNAERPLISSGDIVGDAIPASLTGEIGDAREGQRIFTDRASGHCVLCHAVDGLQAEFQGNVGPNLTGVGDRLTAGQLRLRVSDYQIIRPGTVMPSYYRRNALYDVGEDYAGVPILTAGEVEHLVAYLVGLKE